MQSEDANIKDESSQPTDADLLERAELSGDSQSGRQRTDCVVVEDYELSVESRMNVDWLYNRKLYEIWAIFDHWPDGMLFNIAGPTSDGVIIQALWANAEMQDKYFGEVGIERFTEVVRTLSTEEEPNPVIADLEPVHRAVRHLSFGRLATAFIDIGADLDESAVHFYGTTPVALSIRFHGLDAEQIDALWRNLDLVHRLHPRMIMRMQEAALLTQILETQVWLTEADARRFVTEELSPAFNSAGFGDGARVEVGYRELKRIAISSKELDPARFDGLE